MIKIITRGVEPVLSGQTPVHKGSSLWAEAEGVTQPSKPAGSPTDGPDGIEHPMAQIGDATFLQKRAEAAEMRERSETMLRVNLSKALSDHREGIPKPPKFPERQLIGCITSCQHLGWSSASHLLVDSKPSSKVLAHLGR